MDNVRVHYDAVGETLSVWFDDPEREMVCEGAEDGTILRKRTTRVT
jgi:hypothetical protein